MALDFSSLEGALYALRRSLAVRGDESAWLGFSDAVRDTLHAGIIQNFEVAYEQSWKVMKRWLEGNLSAVEVDGVTRRHLFRLAAENRLIDDVDVWMTFHKARNETSHIYNCVIAAAVLERCPFFLAAGDALLVALKARND